MTFDKITSILAAGGKHLGDIVYWTLAEARIDRSTLKNIWSAAQLSPAMLPEPPTAEKALKVAVREAAVGQPDRLIRLGLDTEQEIVFAVVRETRHEDGSGRDPVRQTGSLRLDSPYLPFARCPLRRIKPMGGHRGADGRHAGTSVPVG